ncbi:hypothetical protein [Agaribacterium sp. ZY112]|uniref:hypothetical protein n=1 Tax=Agaribacterium sp. ZY112 TaxID=3233574 RepID=UPI003525993E
MKRIILACALSLSAAVSWGGVKEDLAAGQSASAILEASGDSSDLLALAAEISSLDSSLAPEVVATSLSLDAQQGLAVLGAQIQSLPDQAALIVKAAVQSQPNLAQSIVNQAVAAGMNADAAIAAAISGGADPSLLEAPEAGDLLAGGPLGDRGVTTIVDPVTIPNTLGVQEPPVGEEPPVSRN